MKLFRLLHFLGERTYTTPVVSNCKKRINHDYSVRRPTDQDLVEPHAEPIYRNDHEGPDWNHDDSQEEKTANLFSLSNVRFRFRHDEWI